MIMRSVSSQFILAAVGLIGISLSLPSSAETFKCKAILCITSTENCTAEKFLGKDTTIELFQNEKTSVIRFCTPISRELIGKDGSIREMCDNIPFDRVEVRGFCRARGGPSFTRGHENYCGERRKYYRFDDQRDFQLTLDRGPFATFIYNNGYGAVITGRCEEER